MKPNIAIWPIERVKPYEQNHKKHPKEQVAKIAASIKRFGWDQPIVVDGQGVIIKGHGRRLASIELGLKEVPVWVRDDLTPEQVRASRLADNKVAESDIDTEMFRRELADLDYDLGDFFDAKELEFAVADLGEIDMSGFVADVGAAVAEQTEQTRKKAAEAAVKAVPLSKVLGFSHVSGQHQLPLSRFMAYIEHLTGKKGEDAMVDFAGRTLAGAA